MIVALAFLEAVRAGDLEALREAARETPTLANTHDVSGVSAVMLAMYHRHADAARLLAEMGAEIGPFEACVPGQADRLKGILAADRGLIGGDSPDRFPLLHLSAFFGQPEAAEILLAAGADAHAEAHNKIRVRPLHSPAAADQTRIALALIAHGADVNVRQQGGFTPLHASAQNGNLELVQALLDHGADAAGPTDEGKTATESASEARKGEMIELFQAPGASWHSAAARPED